ncbi:MAG TPA: hypothetical protein VER32_15650 [Pyrinomonadaceae bacterium]|nr:hypothetical protein [Pyrinomonadaceae bacterium]
MKPLASELQDEESLRKLGSASVQIVHDLKNQLNGLKLYATLLRKRLEKQGAPAEDLETVGKIAAGLDRAAADMNTLVRLGRPVELRRRPRTDLAQIVAAASSGAGVETGPGNYEGEFDAGLLTDALRGVSEEAAAAQNGAGAQDVAGEQRPPLKITLRREEAEGGACAVVEWRGAAREREADPFGSFTGGRGLRLALAAKVIRAHGGEVSHAGDTLRARLPLGVSS